MTDKWYDPEKAQNRVFAKTGQWEDDAYRAVWRCKQWDKPKSVYTPRTDSAPTPTYVEPQWIRFHYNDKERDEDDHTEVSSCRNYWRTKVTPKD